MSRIDFYHDPTAPKANSIVPSVTAAVRDRDKRILLIKKTDNGYWALPGGAMEAGESVSEAAVREVIEESGIDIEITGLVGIYTDPGHVMKYDDGEVRQEFSVCFHAVSTGGEPRHDEVETSQALWFHPTQVEELSIHPSMRRRINDALRGDTRPVIV